MDCAPFKKPSRKAGLFSYRSVIPPSPHETLLRKFPRGPRRPAGGHTGSTYRLRRAFLFHKKLIARSLCCSSFPHETLLRKFPRGPGRPAGGHPGTTYRLRRFFCKSHRALIPLRLLLPTKFCLRKVSWGPPPLRGRQSASGASPAVAFCFVFRPLLDRGGRICYADSQIIRKESVTHKTMDDGDSTEGENPPLPHIQSFIGHSLCLRE